MGISNSMRILYETSLPTKSLNMLFYI